MARLNTEDYKKIRSLKNVCEKKSGREILKGVSIETTKDALVAKATNSYVFVERLLPFTGEPVKQVVIDPVKPEKEAMMVDINNSKNGVLIKQEAFGSSMEALVSPIPGQFPDPSKLKRTDEPKLRVILRTKVLKDLLAALPDLDVLAFEFYGPEAPVQIKFQDGEGLLMPCRQPDSAYAPKAKGSTDVPKTKEKKG